MNESSLLSNQTPELDRSRNSPRSARKNNSAKEDPTAAFLQLLCKAEREKKLSTHPALSSLPRQDTARKKAADQFHVIHNKTDRPGNHQIKLTKPNSEKKTNKTKSKTQKQKSKNKTKQNSECFLLDVESGLKKQATKGEGGQLEGRGQVREEGEWV